MDAIVPLAARFPTRVSRVSNWVVSSLPGKYFHSLNLVTVEAVVMQHSPDAEINTFRRGSFPSCRRF